MQTYHDVIQEADGDVVSTATVTVYLAGTGTLAALKKADETTAINNPFTVSDDNYDSDGTFWFKAVNGAYDIKIVSGAATKSKYDIVLFDSNDPFIATGTLKSGYVVANKAEAAALTLTASDAGRKIFITSDDGESFTVRYNATPGTYADDGGAYCGTVFIPSGGDGTIGIERNYSGAVNVKWFGAVIDGSTDDLSAVQAASNAIPSTGGALDFPDGTCFMSDKFTVTNKPINIRGIGMGVSVLEFGAASTGGIAFTTDDILDNFTVENLTLLTNAAAGGDAIKATWPTTASSTSQSCFISNVEIAPKVLSSDYWTNGIVLSDGWNAVITNCWIRGQDNNRSMTNGILLNTNSNDVQINKCHIYFCTTGIAAGGTVEGASIQQCVIVYVTTGVSMSTAVGEALCVIDNSHISAFEFGISLSNRPQSTITNNLIYKRSDSSSNFVGIQLSTNSNQCRIMGNMIRGAGTGGTENGIVVVSGNRALIIGNVIENQGTAIWLQAGSASCTVMGNRGDSNTNLIVNSGSDNLLKYNIPADSVSTFADADTTPRVDGSQTDFFRTANTGATTITNFDQGYIGQVIYVLANDANTTIQHNATLNLEGGVNWAMGNGAILTMRQDSAGGLWREVARRT